MSIFLFLATWALLHRLQEGSRWSGPLVVLATVAGLLFQERAVLYPVVLGFVAIAFAEAVGLRRVVRPSGTTGRCGCPPAPDRYVVAHRELAPIARTSPGSVAASAELVGNFVARNAVPGFVGGPWSTRAEHHRGPDRMGGGPELGRGGRPRRPDASPLGSAVWGWLLLLVYTLVDVVLLFGGRTGPDFGTALG